MSHYDDETPPSSRCECCSWEGDFKDCGSTGHLNGDLPICPQCGAVDTIDDIEE